MTLKVHHLRPAPGAKTAKTRVGRGEAQQGQDGRSWHQGHEGPLPGPGPLRGRADAAAHAAAQAQGLHEPEPGRVPGRQRGLARCAVPAGRRRSTSTTSSPPARSAAASRSRSSATATSPSRCRSARTRSRRPQGARSRRREAPPRASPDGRRERPTRRAPRPHGAPVPPQVAPGRAAGRCDGCVTVGERPVAARVAPERPVVPRTASHRGTVVTAQEGLVLTAFASSVPYAGPAQEAAVHARHPGAVPAGVGRADPGRRLHGHPALHQRGRGQLASTG